MMRKVSIATFSLVVIAVILNLFKEDLYLAKLGYAPSEMKFTFYIIMPLIFASFFISIFIYVRELLLKEESKKPSIINLLMALPGLLFGSLFLVYLVFMLS